ncbi:hypothetical protein D0466_19185 [Peribacillus glennii]|uniref:ATLF-like domain-containing protein n=2 Tax=Peribacillus glennii TaxID=2303991 RepID=A0A372L7G3_9BACI|nr:hypothetical protein D0466_19185 [Peribacillus glennii]
MLSRLDNIPAKLLKQLYENGYNIKLVNGPITNEPEMEEFKGVTPRGWEGTGLTWDDVPGAGGNPVIVRIGYSERGKGHGAINLELHETAHAIDYMLDISHSSKFIKVWKAEQKKVLKASYYQYPEEYFAETFAMYYLSSASRKQLSAKAPLTVKFIKGL